MAFSKQLCLTVDYVCLVRRELRESCVHIDVEKSIYSCIYVIFMLWNDDKNIL